MAFEFSPNQLHRLNQLVFRPRHNPTEISSGEHRIRRSGDGYDFLDFREYVRGDDVRKIDWGLYSRLRKFYVRIHEAPRQTSITFVVDTSQSMEFGAPRSKLTQAQLIAGGLSFIALRGGDRVYFTSFGAAASALLGPYSSLRQHSRLINFMQNLECSGPSHLLDAVRIVASRRLHRGMVVLLSDFLGTGDIEPILRILGSSGGQVLGIQILAREDTGEFLAPGVVHLQDSETGEMIQVAIDDSTIAAYRHHFRLRRELLQKQFVHRGHEIITTTTEDDYLRVISNALSAGSVRR